MRFLVDAQLPPALARAFINAGHEADTVHDLSLESADDDVIWNYATTHHATIVTKDEDFALRVWRGATGPTVVWLRMGNCSNKALLQILLPLLSEIVERIRLGDRLVEVG